MRLTTNDHHINYHRIEQAIAYLHENFQRQPDLDEVAARVHLSPFHFQRIFTEWAGISPKRFLQFLTAQYLKQTLRETNNLEEAAAAAGLSGQSRVYDLFTTLEAVTPAEYRKNGAGILIEYGFHFTTFGECLIGVTDRGVCWLAFLQPQDDRQAALASMKRFWFNSATRENRERAGAVIAQIFHRGGDSRFHLLVKGTNFQIKVWEALLRIAPGSLTTYQEVARRIDHPRAVQAVGSAVGANTIALLIPCHRVIRKDGILGDYRWSAEKKKTIIGWEMAQAQSANNH